MDIQKYKIDIILELVFIILELFLQIIINVGRIILMTQIVIFPYPMLDESLCIINFRNGLYYYYSFTFFLSDTFSFFNLMVFCEPSFINT